MLYPTLNSISRAREWTYSFSGLDRRPLAYNGAQGKGNSITPMTFSAMGNMSGEQRPLLCSRKKRGIVAELEDPQALAALGKLAWIDGGTLYYGGEPTAVNDLSTDADMLPKRLITMGAYLIIMPDKRYFNTADPADTGSIERLYATETGVIVRLTLCDMDGTEYPEDEFFISDRDPLLTYEEWAEAQEEGQEEEPGEGTEDPPQLPEEGDYWLDTSRKPHALYQLYEGEWVGIPALYVKIQAVGIGQGLARQDGVRISGIEYAGEDTGLGEQIEALNGTHIVQAVSDNFIVVAGVIDAAYTQYLGTVRADRRMPETDFLFECNNRLWGCRYGEQDGETVNRLYASALGDFKNWEKYQGTSMDSYYANIGAAGPFTGGAAHRSYPHFFKENCVYKIFGDKPSSFQTQVTECDGVKRGCADSLIGYNGLLYYVGNNGPVSFESLPVRCGEALGDERTIVEAVAGQAWGNYYLSAKGEDGQWDLYVLDTDRGAWYREDDSHALAFAELNGEMYMLHASGLLYALNGSEGEEEPEPVTWYAETAVMGYEYPDHKYLSRFLLRMKLAADAECDISVQYDSDGIWRHKGTIQGADRVKTCLLPIVPRRCEHMQVRIEGRGEMQLWGVARELSMGRE